MVLGEPVYEACCEIPVSVTLEDLPPFAHMEERGDNWLRFRIEYPRTNNAELLRWLLAKGLKVQTFQAIPQTLEDVYLRAMQQA